MNQVTMPWLNDQRCKEKYPTANVTVAVCAGETGGNLDTCQVEKNSILNQDSIIWSYILFKGDSGGPLVVKSTEDGRYYAGGITSWGYGCNDGGVYTRTSFYYDWISEVIKN